MKSMTCYGSASQKTEFGQIEVSLKSINGRFLEIRTNVPAEYLKFENEMRKKISKYFQRGTVSLFINRKKNSSFSQAKVVLKKDFAKKWHKAFQDLSKELGLKLTPTFESMVQIPNLFAIEEDTEIKSKELKIVHLLIDKAIKKSFKEKTREGVALQKEIRNYTHELDSQTKIISKCADEQLLQIKSKFQASASASEAFAAPDQRLAQEVSTQIDRADISEEIFRLKEHIMAVKKLLGSSELLGKKLDFYTQELLREINTIGSKSQMFKITQAVINSKTIIEKIREQSQNIE